MKSNQCLFSSSILHVVLNFKKFLYLHTRTPILLVDINGGWPDSRNLITGGLMYLEEALIAF